MTAYYNEIDPSAAQWLRNLIQAGHIAPGVVDERSIEDVRPDDLRGFTQCHFFAGIGVWSHALRSAGWGDDRPVWTGSCPCQPFSAAGTGAGFADERHLWPAFHHLIEQCRPAIVFGEQVASKDANPWIDLVQTDLEALGYGVGAVAFPSAGVGAPHIRDRLYWMANTESTGHEAPPTKCREQSGEWATDAPCAPGGFSGHDEPCPTNGFWRDADWLLCRDGKWRPVEPGTFPLAHGAASRVVRLRAYGNAINSIAAKTFIESVMEIPMTPCHCWVCRGRPVLPAAPGRPARYIHEEGGAVAPPLASPPVEAPSPPPPPRVAPPPRPRVAPVGTLDERIAAIEARTDIGAGMKAMQIRNLRAKACR